MKAIAIPGWKAGVEVPPVTLLHLLREGLDLDLPNAKNLLDHFAEDGELLISVADDDKATRFRDLARKVGIFVTVREAS